MSGWNEGPEVVGGPRTGRHREAFGLEGAQVGGYAVRQLIGRGGMAYVYRAEDRHLGRTVALKVLAPELSRSEDFRRRFLRESQLAASIDHPNIIPIYDAGEIDGLLYIAMRYVHGSDLRELLASGVQLGTSRALEIFFQVAAALDTAHARGLVHRDVKPANILIAPPSDRRGREHVYLSDFGLTKRVSSTSGVTAAGAVIGTMDYVAPEQIAGKPVDGRTDVYALGCVVYQALTGSLPFVREDEAALLWAHLVEPLPPMSQLRPDLPPGAHVVVARAMAKATDDRYPTCGEFVTELAMALEAPDAWWEAAAAADIPVPRAASPTDPPPVSQPPPQPAPEPAAAPTPPPAPPPAPAPRTRRRPGGRLLLGIAAAVVVLAVVLGVVFLSGRTSDTRDFPASDVVPYSFSTPADWTAAGGGLDVVVSPHPDELFPLFDQRGSGDTWAAVTRLLESDADGVVGMYTSSLFQTPDLNGDLVPILEPLLPATASFSGGSTPVVVGGTQAVRLGGTLSDPAAPTTQLRFEHYVIPVSGGELRTVHLTFFAAADRFEAHRTTFEAILASVQFPPG